MEKIKDKFLSDQVVSKLKIFNIVLILILFSLNFLGSPLVKYFILIQFLLTLFASFRLPARQSILFLLTFLIFEGQGRIVWEYAAFSRIMFDSCLFALFLRTLTLQSLRGYWNRLPSLIILLFILHFLCYLIGLFNPLNPSFINSLLSAKLYILPMIVFFGLLKSPIDFDSKDFKSFCYILLLLLFLENLLIFYQTYMKESLLLSISDYYSVGKAGVFVGSNFRAWGTSFFPSSVSVFFPLLLVIPFLYSNLNDYKNMIRIKVIAILLIAPTLVSIFLLEVRSAGLKYLLVLMGLVLIYTLKNKYKFRFIFKMLITTLFIAGSLSVAYYGAEDTTLSDLASDKTSMRWLEIGAKNFNSRRLTMEQFFEVAEWKLAPYPIGLGPGASFISFIGEVSDKSPTKIDFWHYDNLLLALITDLGYLAIFSALLIFGIVFYVFVLGMREKDIYRGRNLLLIFVTLGVVILGEWGSYSLFFNPVSFLFWLLLSMAINNAEITKEEDMKIEL